MEMLNRRLEEARQARLDRAKGEIAARVACVCGHLSPEEFDALVTRMAEVQIKFTMRRSLDMFPPREDDPTGRG